MKKLNKLVEENTKSKSKFNSYNRLLNLSLNRKIIKKAQMVKPYNASLVSMAEDIIKQMLPMTNDQWPMTNDQWPRTKDQWPRTKDQGPMTNGSKY